MAKTPLHLRRRSSPLARCGGTASATDGIGLLAMAHECLGYAVWVYQRGSGGLNLVPGAASVYPVE
jgi:hypothetical protein